MVIFKEISGIEMLSDIYELWKKCFPDKTPLSWKILKNRVEIGISTGVYKIFAAFEGPNIIGAVLNELECKCLHGKAYKLNHVAMVAVSPEVQGRGVGSRLMVENRNYLQTQKILFSYLGGLCSFYSKFSYVPVEEYVYEFSLNDLKAGNSLLCLSNFLNKQEYFTKPKNIDSISELKIYLELEFKSGNFESEWKKKIFSFWEKRFESNDDDVKYYAMFSKQGDILAGFRYYLSNNKVVIVNFVDADSKVLRTLFEEFALAQKKDGFSEIVYNGYNLPETLKNTPLLLIKKIISCPLVSKMLAFHIENNIEEPIAIWKMMK